MTDEKKKKLNDLRAQLDRLGYGQNVEKKVADSTRDEIRRAVHKKRTHTRAATPSEKQILYRRDICQQSPRREPAATKGYGQPKVVLKDAAEGSEVVSSMVHSLW